MDKDHGRHKEGGKKVREDTEDAKPTNGKVKRRAVEQGHQRKDEESEQGDRWTKGDEEKTDVFRDIPLPSVFSFLVKILLLE